MLAKSDIAVIGDGVALAPVIGLYLAAAIAREGNCGLPGFPGELKLATAARR